MEEKRTYTIANIQRIKLSKRECGYRMTDCFSSVAIKDISVVPYIRDEYGLHTTLSFTVSCGDKESAFSFFPAIFKCSRKPVKGTLDSCTDILVSEGIDGFHIAGVLSGDGEVFILSEPLSLPGIISAFYGLSAR